MSIIVWRDEFMVNVAAIDTDHRRMSELANELHDAVVSNSEMGVLQERLLALIEFTRMHFAAEEQLMLEHHYPDHPAHKSEHDLLLAHLLEMADALAVGNQPVFTPELDVSSDWVMVHINDHDHNLGKFLNSRGIY